MDDNTGFLALQNEGSFEIEPCSETINLEDSNKFTRLWLNQDCTAKANALVQYIPSMLASSSLANAYRLEFPKGLPHTLTNLKQGGMSTKLRGANGRFVGDASMYEIDNAQQFILSSFTAMSIATGQYFMSQINTELKMIKLTIDKILEFLYGDKKAELLSEVNFAKYAYQNYNSIMAHNEQRIATIAGLQESKKVAMKDIEFYMSDLESNAYSKVDDISEFVDRSFQIKQSLDLSMQLFVMSGLFEVFYSQNFDPQYVAYIEHDMSVYIDKCEKRILSSFSVVNKCLSDHKGKAFQKIDKSLDEKRVGEVLEFLNSGEDSSMKKVLSSSLKAATKKTEYYLNNDGQVYLKNTQYVK